MLGIDDTADDEEEDGDAAVPDGEARGRTEEGKGASGHAHAGR